MSETSACIDLIIRDHIAFLTFARPAAANTINLQLARDFLAAVFAIEASAQVRAVVMTGQGKNFCFGGDLKEIAASSDVQSYLSELTATLHAGVANLTQLNAPVIAAVNGTAAGAGLGLVLAADLAIGSRSAKFLAAYTAVALTPDASCTFLLPRAVGSKRAREMLMTNRVVDASQALEWGLVNEVVDDDKLLETATALATRLSAGPVGAYGAVKRLLSESQPGLESQLGREGRSIAARGVTAEGREGIAAFLAKRAPRFT